MTCCGCGAFEVQSRIPSFHFFFLTPMKWLRWMINCLTRSPFFFLLHIYISFFRSVHWQTAYLWSASGNRLGFRRTPTSIYNLYILCESRLLFVFVPILIRHFRIAQHRNGDNGRGHAVHVHELCTAVRSKLQFISSFMCVDYECTIFEWQQKCRGVDTATSNTGEWIFVTALLCVHNLHLNALDCPDERLFVRLDCASTYEANEAEQTRIDCLFFLLYEIKLECNICLSSRGLWLHSMQQHFIWYLLSHSNYSNGVAYWLINAKQRLFLAKQCGSMNARISQRHDFHSLCFVVWQ